MRDSTSRICVCQQGDPENLERNLGRIRREIVNCAREFFLTNRLTIPTSMRNLLNSPLRPLWQVTSLANSCLRYAPVIAMVLTASALIGGIHLARARAGGTIGLTTLGAAYTQNFDTLANSGTSSVVPIGWDFAEAGANANTTYTAGAGSSTAGDTYSFGASGSSERAFGGLQSGSLVPTIGASFTNNTGTTITSLQISFTGEQWRIGNTAAARDDRLDFQYSADAASLTTGNWNDVNSLDFTNPVKTAGTAGALDGNTGANRAAISFTITGLSLANGATFFIRWLDFNASGSDDGLAIDDFSLTPIGAGSTPLLSINDVTANEGASGATAFTFTVSLTAPAGVGGVTFDIATQDNTATTADNDYVARSLASQTIPQGQMTHTFGVTVNGDMNVEPNETFFVNVANVAGANVADGQGTGAIVNDDFAITLIHDIQGDTETPNFVGMVKAIRGVVVGDFQGSANLSGFFVQEEDADADADPATSEGVFIFDPGALTDVKVGDNVTVIGTVTNFGAPLGLTELTNLISVVVNSSGAPLPAASAVSLPVANAPAVDLERFEGMRVTFNQTLFVTGNDDLGGFGELILSANSPLYIPTNSIDPNDDPASGNSISGNSNVAAVTTRQTINNNNRIVLNDGKTGSNPNPIPFIGAGANATIRRGDSIANLSGVLSFGFGAYRIEPTALPLSFTASNPRQAAPDSVGGALRVASFNVENFFLTTNPASGYRGPNNATELMRKRDKVVAALARLNADVIGLIELEKATTQGSAAADLAAALTTAMGAGANTYVAIADPATFVGTDPDIKNGVIYRASAVTPVGGVLTDTSAPAGTYSRDPISQTFQRISTGDKFTIVVNHFRSKSCSGASGADADQGDGQACFNARRRSQAQALLAFINNTLIPIDPDVLVVGDLNAYAQEDPIDVFRAAGHSDVLARFVAGPSQYSFTFNGEAGRLDHAFATGSLDSQITGATIWHINSDEPDVFDYNTENKPDDRYAPTPFRSADHDPILIGLNLFTPITISGQKFNDLDGDGVKDVGEPGLQGVTIRLDKGSDGVVDASTTTDSNGNYSFTNLGPGVYRIREVAPANSAQTTANPADIVASSGTNVAGVDFGNFTMAPLSLTTAIIADPMVCLGPGGVAPIRSTVTNNSTNAQTASFTATLDSALRALPGSCSANAGSCSVVNASTVTWTGTLNTGQTVTINYQAQVADGVEMGTQVCVNSTASAGAGAVGGVKACATVNCQAAGPGALPQSASPVSDQQAGSVLIYNIYTSTAGSPNTQNTRISVTNTEPSRAAVARLFFVDGSSCSVTDSHVCLTPNQTATFLASDLDPGVTGYIVAVAVDQKGCPAPFNYLIGDEYVKFTSGRAANLGAEAITAIAGGLSFCNANSETATLSFDGVSYGILPRAVALDNIPSRADGNDTLLILNRIGGDLATGAATLGPIFGALYGDGGGEFSFSFRPGTCQFRSSLSPNFPRIATRLDNAIPAGRSGWMKLYSTNDQGILGAAINFDTNAEASVRAFNHGHNLRKLTTTPSASYTIPIFPPNC